MSSRVTEILSVLRILASLPAAGLTLRQVREERIAATKAVAATQGITHETVRDALTRQLFPDVQGIGAFDRMVLEWRTRDSRELERAIQQHAVDETDRGAITGFFHRHANPR